MQITSIQYSDYVGRIGIGRIYNGKIKTGQQVIVAKRDGTHRQVEGGSRFSRTTAWAVKMSTRPRPVTSFR